MRMFTIKRHSLITTEHNPRHSWANHDVFPFTVGILQFYHDIATLKIHWDF